MEEPERGTEGFGLLDLGGGAGDFRCTAVLMTWGIFMSHSEEDPTHKSALGGINLGNSDALHSEGL